MAERPYRNPEIEHEGYMYDMSVVEQISVPSEHVTLEPGDILLTGTPAGVGMATDTYLRAGDKIEAEIEGLGKLEVEIISVVAMPRTPRPG